MVIVSVWGCVMSGHICACVLANYQSLCGCCRLIQRCPGPYDGHGLAVVTSFKNGTALKNIVENIFVTLLPSSSNMSCHILLVAHLSLLKYRTQNISTGHLCSLRQNIFMTLLDYLCGRFGQGQIKLIVNAQSVLCRISRQLLQML